MHRTLKKLYRDHAHFNRLMDVLERQLEELDAAGRSVSPLLKDLIAYVGDYVDTFHHPIEDQLYQMMLARTDNGREQMDRLLGDHLVITNMTRKLRNALAAIDENGGHRRNEAQAMGRELVKQQRDHMLMEEKDAFPLLREELTPEDFDHAARAIPALEDPMLDAEQQERYPALFEHLRQNP
jgi:hemerythrin-like domain-containing protein